MKLFSTKRILVFIIVAVFLFGTIRLVVDVKYLDWKSRTEADLNVIAAIVETYKEYYGHYPSSFDELYADPDLKQFQSKFSSNNRYEYQPLPDGFLVRATKSHKWFFKADKIENKYTALEAHTKFGKNAPRK